MNNEQIAQDLIEWLNFEYKEFNFKRIENAVLLTLRNHERKAKQEAAKRCREIAQQRFLAKEQAIEIDAKISEEFDV